MVVTVLIHPMVCMRRRLQNFIDHIKTNTFVDQSGKVDERVSLPGWAKREEKRNKREKNAERGEKDCRWYEARLSVIQSKTVGDTKQDCRWYEARLSVIRSKTVGDTKQDWWWYETRLVVIWNKTGGDTKRDCRWYVQADWWRASWLLEEHRSQRSFIVLLFGTETFSQRQMTVKTSYLSQETLYIVS